MEETKKNAVSIEYTKDNPLKVITLFSGYDSQCLALDRLCREYPEFAYQLVGWCEIEKSACIAHDALYPDASGLNLGDISAVDVVDVPDCDLITWSFPCFVSGTLIFTGRGLLPIEEVVVGDVVLTHSNQFQEVLAVGSRSGASLLKVRGMCCNDILCTPNHPFYVRKRYRRGHNSERCFTEPEWVAAVDLTRDCYLGYAVNQKSELPEWGGVVATRWHKRENKLSAMFENPSFWYLMGRYVGDGWKRKNRTGRGIVICCSDRNRESLLKSIDACDLCYTSVQERTVEKILISMNELYAFVGRYGYYAHGKSIDIETLNLPDYLLRSFVDGYVDSDGCYTENEYKVSSVSKNLIYGIAHCITKAYRCPVRIYYTKRKKVTEIEGRVVNQRDSWSAVWHRERRAQDKAFYEDGYVWFPIREIIAIEEKATVYNMEVANDNSYTANGAIVHNCTDISGAGRQAGLSRGSGTRSSLAWEALRLFRGKRPKYLLMENVSDLVGSKFIRDFHALLSELEDIGYESFTQVLDARDYGVPQHRERVFVVSILRDESKEMPYYNFPEPFGCDVCLEDLLEEEVDRSYYLSKDRVLNFSDGVIDDDGNDNDSGFGSLFDNVEQ